LKLKATEVPQSSVRFASVPTPNDLDEILDLLAPKLWEVAGVKGVALLATQTNGISRSDADIEVAVLYFDDEPFEIAALRSALEEVNDHLEPVVTEIGGLGPWMNGSAQLIIGGFRVDVLFRSVDSYRRVIAQAKQGFAEHDWLQQPPYGFASVSYLGEVDVATPLLDPKELWSDLKESVRPYPPQLKANLVAGFLWGAEHTVESSRGAAVRNDVYATMGAVTRTAAMLTFAIYAMNERYYISDRGALDVLATFELAPPHCHARIHDALRDPHLAGAVSQLSSLIAETRLLSRQR
jgi:hypothetical protein